MEGKRKKLISGVGVNDADYFTTRKELVNGKYVTAWMCPVYVTWLGMLRRCYNRSLNKDTTYEGCTVCKEWLYFSNFKAWTDTQNWEGKYLDKDLLSKDSKVYSPETCVFVDRIVNNFTTLRGKRRGGYPIGVSLRKPDNSNCKVLYKAGCCTNGRNGKYLGLYATPMLAHKAWQVAKRDQAIHLQSQQTDSRVIAGLQRIIDKLNNHIENNIETKSL